VARMLESDVDKLIHMEELLKQRVVGQDEAVHDISNALRRARSGLQDPDRPIGSFILWDRREWERPNWPRHLREFSI